MEILQKQKDVHPPFFKTEHILPILQAMNPRTIRNFRAP